MTKKELKTIRKKVHALFDVQDEIIRKFAKKHGVAKGDAYEWFWDYFYNTNSKQDSFYFSRFKELGYDVK